MWRSALRRQRCRLPAPSYSPAALVFVDFTWRLAGVREQNDALEWNLRPGHSAAGNARFSILYSATMQYDQDGAKLLIDGREIRRVASGVARVLTDRRGRLETIVGISEKDENISLVSAGRRPQNVRIQPPNERRTISPDEMP